MLVVTQKALFKIHVQEYALKAANDLPLYYTVNEGRAHAPMYMSAGTYTSPNVFSDQGPQISDESCQLQEEVIT